MRQKFISSPTTEVKISRAALPSLATVEEGITRAVTVCPKLGIGQSRSARRFRQHKRRRIAAYVTLALTTAFGLRWHEANRPPVPSGPAPLRHGEAVVSGPNAVHFYAIAADSLSKEVMQAGDMSLLPMAERRTLVAANATALGFLRQGFAYRYQGRATNWLRTAPTASLNDPVPNFAVQRQMARLLQAEASVRAQAGNQAGAIQSSLDAIRFGQDVAHTDNGLIGVMIGNLCIKFGLEDAPQYLYGLSGRDARAAARRLEALVANEPTITDAITAERQMSDSLLSDFSTASFAASIYTSRRWYLPTIFWYGKQGIADHVTGYLDAQMQRAVLPYQQSRKLLPVPLPADVISQEILPNFERAALSVATTQAKENVLLARLAVQAYRAEHGGIPPSSLDVLTQGANPYLLRVPTDPFSPTGDAPLTYADGKVSSVGPNGIDEQGKGDDI